jgi:hypothetical protein
MYVDTLRRLRDAVRRKRSEKWRTNSWFLLHDNAPAHRSVLVKHFLAKNNVTTLELTPELAPADFYLFPQLKPALKEWRFCEATEIIKNATKELKRFSQNDFQGCFQHIYIRWQKYIVAQGDYSERNVAEMIVLFCISEKQLIPGIFCGYHVDECLR